MTATATATAPRQTVTDDLPSWTRATYKGHGRPTRFYYWGTGSQANEEDGLLVTSVKVTDHNVIMKGANATRKVDVRMRFWISPAPELVPQPRNGQPTEDTQAIVKAARPSRNAKLSDCRCGCGQKVKGLYKQGHDARHAGNVAREALAAGADADLNEILAKLPTEALRIKAANMVASRVK
jgi:hypothetical protein